MRVIRRIHIFYHGKQRRDDDIVFTDLKNMSKNVLVKHMFIQAQQRGLLFYWFSVRTILKIWQRMGMKDNGENSRFGDCSSLKSASLESAVISDFYETEQYLFLRNYTIPQQAQHVFSVRLQPSSKESSS
ncbi:hypothetical protein ACJX0J_009228 [Zea mays]